MPIDKVKIAATFQQVAKNRTISEAEVKTLKALAAGDPEGLKLVQDLFLAEQARTPGLKVAASFIKAFGQAAGPAPVPVGRIDQRPVKPSGAVVDLDKLNALFPGATKMASVKDAFCMEVDLGGGHKVVSPTHLFGDTVNVIPYSDDDGGVDAAGKAVAYGDQAIGQYFKPGEIGFAIKHHRPANRALGGANDKENLKLQDTHIEIVVGVEEKGADGKVHDGAITINNPQNYQRGEFGDASYPMVFVRPKFPPYLDATQVRQFTDNVRTMAVCFNTVTKFPGDYNGGDPLGARTPGEVKKITEMMIRAVGGDPEAAKFFEKKENAVYCAELAHLSTTAGTLFPLNKATWGPVVGDAAWAKFEKALAGHNAREAGAFTKSNQNPNIGKVGVALAPETLKPVTEYAPAAIQAELKDKLAFQPMTMSDIVEQFLRTSIPRESKGGEALAPAQAALLEKTRPGLLEAMGLASAPPTDPRRQAVEKLFDQIVAAVGKSYDNYASFRVAIKPLLAQAREMTGPRGDGVGLFTPPSMFHVIAQGKQPGGLIGLEYVGHGLHYSVIKQQPG